MGQAKYQTDGDPKTSGPGFGVAMHEDSLDAPLHWRAPRKVFVNSMSDLFHASITDEFIAKVFAVMALAPQHVFQVLTKRHGRMRSLLNSDTFVRDVLVWCHRLTWGVNVLEVHPHILAKDRLKIWPLPNLHLGVSVEDQHWADLRIPALLRTPAAVRWISAEPLLGPIDLQQAVRTMGSERGHGLTASFVHTGVRNGCCRQFHGLSWAVVGGESGRGARPMDVEWARSLVDQCQAADVPVFTKQLGSVWAKTNNAAHSKGGDPDEWQEELRVRQWPQTAGAL
jgi:protein gp37